MTLVIFGRVCKRVGPELPPHPTNRHPRAEYCWTCQEVMSHQTDAAYKRRWRERQRQARLTDAATLGR